MNIEFDAEADAIYVRFREQNGRITSRVLDDRRTIDVDDEGEVGIELLFVSQGVSLGGLPRRDEIVAALNAIPHPV